MNALVKQINGKVTLTTEDDREIYMLEFKKGVWKGSASHLQPKI